MKQQNQPPGTSHLEAQTANLDLPLRGAHFQPSNFPSCSGSALPVKAVRGADVFLHLTFQHEPLTPNAGVAKSKLCSTSFFFTPHQKGSFPTSRPALQSQQITPPPDTHTHRQHAQTHTHATGQAAYSLLLQLSLHIKDAHPQTTCWRLQQQPCFT